MTEQQFNEMMEVLERIADNTQETVEALNSIKRNMPSSILSTYDMDDLHSKLSDIETAILNQ